MLSITKSSLFPSLHCLNSLFLLFPSILQFFSSILKSHTPPPSPSSLSIRFDRDPHPFPYFLRIRAESRGRGDISFSYHTISSLSSTLFSFSHLYPLSTKLLVEYRPKSTDRMNGRSVLSREQINSVAY